jgi:hypothetical protein
LVCFEPVINIPKYVINFLFQSSPNLDWLLLHLYHPHTKGLLLWGGTGWIQLKIDVCMNQQFKKVMKKSLQQDEGHLPLVPYCNDQRNKCLYFFISSPTACIWTYLPQHPDKTAWQWNLNIVISLELKLLLEKYEDIYSQLQIL